MNQQYLNYPFANTSALAPLIAYRRTQISDATRRRRETMFQLSAAYISKAHTTLASAAFLSALIISLRLHYRKVVKNEVAGYPDEWWPSVSATIGDWYPERSVFQILIALTAGPRFALVFCWWFLTRSTTSILPTIVAICGIVRSVTCGGWVYITSSDDHDAHDVLMVSYMVLNLPWMIGSIICTPAENNLTRRQRKITASLFFLAIVPMVYFFVQHKVHLIPGAYTKYSFCEWFLIMTDVWFDSITSSDFSELEISVYRPSTEVVSSERSPSMEDTQPFSLKPPPPQSSHRDLKTQLSSSHPEPHSSFMTAFRVRLGTPLSLRYMGSFLADVYLAYVWWSIFTALAPSVFYFSVWQLSLSGQEVSLFATLSPILLGMTSVHTSLSTQSGRTWLQIMSVLGLVAYKIEHPLLRLIAVTCANISGSLLRAIEWSSQQEAEKHGIILALGLVGSSLSKLVNHTVNPIWSFVDGQSGGWNKIGILLAVLAVQEYATRDQPGGAYRGQTGLTTLAKKLASSSSQKPRTNPSDSVVHSTDIFEHWAWASIGLGGLIFSLHCFLTDSGTLVAYSWTGYPVIGPYPGLHGYLTLMAMALGVFISISNAKVVVSHPVWMVFGALSSYLMYQWRDWPGYIAGLCLAVFLTSVIPVLVGIASLHGKHSPAKVYATAWLVVCFLDFAHVWTVAYAFVPTGWLLRERTDIVLTIQMVSLGMGLIPVWQRSSLTHSSIPPSTVEPTFAPHVRRLLALLVSISFLATTTLNSTPTPRPHHADQRLITAGIWTVHFGIDDAGRESQHRMRDLIKDMQLDVVGLLETDLHRYVFGNRDLTRVISEDLGYYVDIGPGPNSHTWGAALLSKFPILSSTHHLLPSPHGELAPAISAILDVWGQNVTVVVSHNGQEEDPLDRELQSAELARIMAATYPDPVIFLGYVVSQPLATRPNPYEILVTDGRVHDIDEEDWDRWCEYILYRGLYRVSYARVSRSTITDTELQVGKFVLPKFGHPVIDAPREERYLRIFRENLPSSMWFPDEYLDKANPGGKRGHFYHVHPWPLYYRLPDNAVV